MFNTTIATQIYAKICFEATNSQKKIIENLSEYLSDDDFSRIFVLNGFAGTGKTTLIAAVVAALKELRIKPVLLAPTGRAAKVLARYCGEQALTIHKRIYRQRTNADYESKFSLDFNREQGAVFIVDEASMLSDSTGDGALFGSGSLLEDLVSYVRSGRGCRLILVGDSAQLPPVGCDFSPALDPATVSRYGEVVYGLMDEVVRQQMQSGILFNATLVRCMLENRIYEIPKFEMDYPDFESVEGGDFLEKLQDAFDRYGRDEVIVITRSNKRANRYNEGIRRYILSAEEEIESGDMLMVVKNNYHYATADAQGAMNFIANGDIARLVRLRRFEDFYGFHFADAVLSFADYGDMDAYDVLVKIDGKVKRPMRFEMKKDESLSTLISYAGGFEADAYTRSLRVVRQNGQEYEVNTVKDLDYSVYKMRNGDVVTAEAILNRFINKLEIRGAVYRPGIYQLNGKLNTVRELVNEAQGLTGDAFLNRAVLYRQREDLTTEVVPVDIKAIMDGTSQNIILMKNDILYIPSIHDLEDRGNVVIHGEVAKPDSYPYADNSPA